MDATLIVTLVFSIISAVLVSVELIVTFFNHRKERTVQAVTEQRANWMQEVRNLFSEIIDCFDSSIDSLITLEKQMLFSGHASDSKRDYYIDELRKHYVKLKLYLNFEHDADKELLNIIEDLICRIDLNVAYAHVINFGDYHISDFVAEKELLSLYMSIYLKAEWERLKKETKTGKADSKYFDIKHKELLSNNKVFVEELKSKAFRAKLKTIKESIESDPQYRGTHIATYNCLNILDADDKKG